MKMPYKDDDSTNESIRKSNLLIESIKNKYRKNGATNNSQQKKEKITKVVKNTQFKATFVKNNGDSSNNQKLKNEHHKKIVNKKKGKNSIPKLGTSYILKKKYKNLKKFPMTTPAQAVQKNYPIKKRHFRKIHNSDFRIITFGGLEQVGINCIGFEYKDEILIVDLGLQFPDKYSNGINFRVPDLTYLKDKKVVGIAITHGHIDHIGAIPHLIQQFDKTVPIYATPMALELINLRQESFGFKPKIFEYNRDKGVNIGKFFNVLPFVVDHSIPDSVGLMINTPLGRIVHTGDWKFDSTPPSLRPSVNYKTLESFGNLGVKMLLSDSTNSFMPGASMSEKEVIEPLEDIFKKANGRIITATFASIIDRIALIIQISEKLGRKVVLLGKGMNDYMNIAKKLGYVQHKEDTIISMKEADKLPGEKVTICCTGAQGERYAALMRMATGESKDATINKGDTVVFSSSVIPGNERGVQELYGICMERGAVIHHYRTSNIHAGGHARNEDIKKMLKLIKPEYFMPIYGERYMLYENAKIAKSVGYTDDKIIIARNGEVIDIDHKTGNIVRNGFVPSDFISVDGDMVGMTKEKELHDRCQMQDSGAIFITVNLSNNRINTTISSAGLPNFNNLLKNLKSKIITTLEVAIITDRVKILTELEKSTAFLTRKIKNLVFQEIEKEPIIIIHILK